MLVLPLAIYAAVGGFLNVEADIHSEAEEEDEDDAEYRNLPLRYHLLHNINMIILRPRMVRIAVFSQHHMDGLDLTSNPLLYMMRCFPSFAELKEEQDFLLKERQQLNGCIIRSSTSKLFTPYKKPEHEFRSSRRHFKTLSLDELRSPDFNSFSDQEYSEEEIVETIAETMEQYMSKTRADYGSGFARPKIEDKYNFELKGQFLKELRTNTFSGSDHEDVNEHIEKVLEFVDLFHIPNITIDQVMLRAFPLSLTGDASRWLRNKPTSSITTWDGLKTKFLNKYCLPTRTAKKMEEINNFQQEPDENLYQAWERFKELLMKCPQHYLTEMQEVIWFYNGLGIPTRQILDSRGAIPSKTDADAKVAIQEMTEYSQKWHNGTSRLRSTETSDGLLDANNAKDRITPKIAYSKRKEKPSKKLTTRNLVDLFKGGYRAAALGFYQRNNANPSYQERRQSMEETLSKFMRESAKRHKENSNWIKEIRASTDATIHNQRASIKTLEIQIGQMSMVLQERGFGILPSSTKANPRD
ncbi:hypothetical protein Tco_1393791 [Tanacetum coccineum]